MRKEDLNLAAYCADMAETADKAIAWLDDNRELVRGEYEALRAEMRKGSRMLRKCRTAALRKMCVGVFGPSQSGKSYLISALARGDGGALMVDFAAEHHDFITKINPEGGKESTGLVTRFTTSAPQALPPGYPVKLRLLSESDVVLVLTNTFYADCEHKEPPDQEELLRALDKLEKKAAGFAAPDSKIDADVVEEMRVYVNKRFYSRPRVQLLDKIYWLKAAELAPRLDLEGRVELFGLIWAGLAPFNALLLKLGGALRNMGYPEEAFCSTDALLPRETSIIDVALLKDILADGHENDLEVATRGQGRDITIKMPRAAITALTAEITMFMPEKPDMLFDHTDLLDFPGYRSRLKLENIAKEIEREGTLENLFLRGKVAYLFERYSAEKELTGMLLCIAPGNQEVQDLPGVIDDWIRGSHGESPAGRVGKAVSLFFVLTKMDVEFEKKKGSPSVELRWKTRIYASLLDFFGKQHDWPVNWDGKNAFNNTFLLRNPNYKFEAIFDFADDREIGIRADQKEYVEEVRRAFLQTPEVAAHFAAPPEAWNAAMTLNDGGITYLKNSLRPVCNPELKHGQICVVAAEKLERLSSLLSPFLKTDDKEQERRQKVELAMKLAKILAGMVENQVFGEFLRNLQVCDTEIYNLYFRTEQSSLREESQENASETAVAGTRVMADDLLSDIFGGSAMPGDSAAGSELFAHDGTGGSPGQACGKVKDEAARFSALIVQYWVERLHAQAADPVKQRYFNFPEKEFGLFVHELTMSMTRLKMPEAMEAALRKASGYGNISHDRMVWKQASLAVDAINSFIDWLGFDPRINEQQKRTVILQGRAWSLFNPPISFKGRPEIGEERAAHERVWYADWLRALVYNINANVDFDGERNFDETQNKRLKSILEQLKYVSQA